MIAAIESVKGGQSVKRAAEVHGVLRTTLQDRVKGKVIHGVNPGPQPYLQPAEEKELSCFLTEVAAVGYRRTKKQVKLLTEMVARDKGVLRSTSRNKGGKVSDGWFRRFMNRQKTITLQKGDPTAQVQMEACSPAIITDQLKEVLEEHDLMDCPGQLYNVDETGMPFDHHSPNVVAKKKGKRKYDIEYPVTRARQLLLAVSVQQGMPSHPL